MTWLAADKTGIKIRIVVSTKSQKSSLEGIHHDRLKLKIAAQPHDNAANIEIVRLMAQLLQVSKSSIRITTGLKSKEKTLFIEGLSIEEAQALIFSQCHAASEGSISRRNANAPV